MRGPSKAELQESIGFLGPKPDGLGNLKEFARAVFNFNSFLYVN